MAWHKYGAKKVTAHAGYSFGSKLEAAVFDILNLLKSSGEIQEIQVQPSVYLTAANILFKPDFKCVKHDGSYFFVEAKGLVTPVYAIKRRLWPHYGDGDLYVYMGHYAKPFLKEVIKSKK